MAAAVVGRVVLSSVLVVLFDKIAKPEVVNFFKGKNLDHEELLRRLKTALLAVNPVLNDAEKKQIQDPAAKEWLDDLNDAVYHADDLVDEIETRVRTAAKEDVLDRIELIAKNKGVLEREEGVGKKFSDKIPSTSLLEAWDVVGREQDKAVIVNLLLSDDEIGNKISVIPIVGMSGIGKTTLAQLVYDDDKVNQRFDLKAWVCVSEELDVLKVTKTILEEVTSKTVLEEVTPKTVLKDVKSCSCNSKNLNGIQLDLKERLKGKKFLIVLDDVWNENYDNWEFLKRPFKYGAEGSKIIVTTRSEKYPVLEKIGRDIMKKCGGLPLAAKTLGGLLRSKYDVEEWNSILKSDMWNLSENESKIVPALRLSYQYLPSNLKRCFMYCSIFPKDYQFVKEDLILLWMAENFLLPRKREKRLEEVGDEYFHDLASRSFFQPKGGSRGRSIFVMHDLIHDLAKYVAGEFCFMSEGDDVHEVTKNTRYLSYKQKHPVLKDFEGFSEIKNLRTLLSQNDILSQNKCGVLYLQEHCPIILPKLKYLRVLSLPCGDFETLPNTIGELIHLRYLDLSFSKIKELTESVCDLYNLQTLKLEQCESLNILPSAMPNLINLRHLDIARSGIKELPKGMSELNSLQFLSDFSVGKNKVGARIGELGKLPDLRGELSISNLEYVVNSKDASEARLKDKKYIEDLQLRWGSDTDIDDSECEKDILDQLQPHTCLKILSIEGYRGTTFPGWLGHASYHNMVFLNIDGCKYCCLLPSLGQLPFLKNLKIEGLHGLVIIGHEFYKNDDNSSSTTLFPALEKLSFDDMPVWEEWSSLEGVQGDVFPRLRSLSVTNCPRLTRGLPHHLPALEYLEIDGCPNLVSSLPRSLEIHDLSIKNCESLKLLQHLEQEELPRLIRSLKIEGCYLVESVCEAMAMYNNDFTPCLEELSISSCSSSISFPEGLPDSLKTLEISYCENLEFPQQYYHVSLESLQIIESCNSLATLGIEAFPSLKILIIEGCENLQSVSEGGVTLHVSTILWKASNLIASKGLRSFEWENFSLRTMMNSLLNRWTSRMQGLILLKNCFSNQKIPSG
ncbi:NB-ARC domain disease resistance protein [Quillaja saponaria]|uniref:NB-ARC domain disease resistance protein n=1 Tax=Quillaja saponaria TaxID=32244 RepID=A0AAD7KWS1_QUISA|nr:NB-ARC domain disease resistance protein [Quillaja saponaria]